MSSFNVVICTRDSRVPINSIMNLMQAAILLGRQLHLIIASTTGLAAVRNLALKKLKESYPDDPAPWAFWLDDDVFIYDDGKRIAQLVLEAETRGLPWVADYHRISDQETLAIKGVTSKTEFEIYHEDELEAAKDFDLKVWLGGFGCCYLKIPTDYKFHTHGSRLEDDLFFEELGRKQEIRFCRVKARHQKLVQI